MEDIIPFVLMVGIFYYDVLTKISVFLCEFFFLKKKKRKFSDKEILSAPFKQTSTNNINYTAVNT